MRAVAVLERLAALVASMKRIRKARGGVSAETKALESDGLKNADPPVGASGPDVNSSQGTRPKKRARKQKARILNCTPEQYLADPCRVPSLSSGVAHALVAESPAHAFMKHPRLGGSANGSPGTKAMNDGALIHKLLLGKGKDVVVVDAPDFRTNLARTARDQALQAGRIPILRHQADAKSIVAEILKDKLLAYGYSLTGKSEVAIEWTAECADGAVLCRSMLDHVYIDQGRIYDVKKVESANPRKLARNFVENGYDIQYAAYTRALAALRPELEGMIDMTFLFVEIEPPYSVVPVEPDGALREIGALRWERAVQLWRQCTDSNDWPGYSRERVLLEAPAYVVTQELGTWQQ